MYSEGLCKAVHIECQGKNIVTDFHVLPIGGCQMVLGVDWLKTFDAVTLSYKYQKVRVSQAGKNWEFQGVQGGDSEMVQAELMD